MKLLFELAEDAEYGMSQWVRAVMAREWMRLTAMVGDTSQPAPLPEPRGTLEARQILAVRCHPYEVERAQAVAQARSVSVAKFVRDEVTREHAAMLERRTAPATRPTRRHPNDGSDRLFGHRT